MTDENRIRRRRLLRGAGAAAAAWLLVDGLPRLTTQGLAGVPNTSESPAAAPPAPWWLARPWHTEPRIRRWADEHPDLVMLETQTTFGGRTAFAVTVTNRKVADRGKLRAIFSQPHAHEPGATAGMMSFLAELIEGKRLDGHPGELPRETLLDRCVLSFIPDGNPDGRARSPEDWWDGAKHTNDQFLDFAFGRLPNGKRYPRLGRWSNRQQQPSLVGCVYEQISEHEFVEPNRDRDSTFFRLLTRLLEQKEYTFHVDLHQTEFEKSDRNAMVILPCTQNELSERIRSRNVELAKAMIAAWAAGGGRPIAEARPLAYGEDQLRYFRKCWGDIYRCVAQGNVEIQNNNPRTTPHEQMRLMEIAIRASIQCALAWK
jgi:hypothetical protein